MTVALNLNRIAELHKNNQATTVLKQAAKEPEPTLSLDEKEHIKNLKEAAKAIKDYKKRAPSSEKDPLGDAILKAQEKVNAALDKLDNAVKKLEEKREEANSLKEKMKNTKNFFKKIGYAIAYAAKVAGLAIAKAGVKIAIGTLETILFMCLGGGKRIDDKLQKIFEKLFGPQKKKSKA